MIPSAVRTGTSGAVDPLLAALIDDLTDRLQAGEPVDFESFLEAHPEHAGPLRQLVPALELIGELKRSAAGAGSSPLASRRDQGLESGVLGDFHILREIGRGGMGLVYEARQISLSRRVALKVLPFAAAIDPRQLQRFQIEAQAAATLHHTNIVPIFSVGCERGVHYYAMQFIEGRTLADVIRELRQVDGLTPPDGQTRPDGLVVELVTGLLEPAGAATDAREATENYASPAALPSPPSDMDLAPQSGSSVRSRAYFRTAARLGLQAAEALEHAHGQGVLHRDIKPSNLLVDGRGNLWITDFGLARVRQDNGLTMTGDVLGTLRYMSPEQATARRALIDERSDVYSLGVTLYELLTLQPAFDDGDRVEVLRRIAQDEPKALRKLNPAVPADLETIVRKAMDKDPAGRYATAGALAGDLRRYLDSRPIVARRPSLIDRATKWALRHRSATVSAAVVVATVLFTAAIAALLVASKERQRGQAAVAVGALESRLRVQAQDQTKEVRRRQVRLNVEQGTRMINDGDLAGALRYFVEALRFEDGNPVRVEDHRVRIGMLLSQCAKPARIWSNADSIDVKDVFWRDAILNLSDVQVYPPMGPTAEQLGRGFIRDISGDGRRIAVKGDDPNAVRVLDGATGRDAFPPLKQPVPPLVIRFSPDGTLLYTGCRIQWRIWDAETGQPVTDWLNSEDGREYCFSRDSRLLGVNGGSSNSMQVYDARTGRPVAPPMLHNHRVMLDRGMGFSPDGRRLVTSCWDGTARVWDVTTGKPLTPPIQHTQYVRAKFSPDGGRVVTSCWDGMARVWDAATGTLRCDPMRHRAAVYGAAWNSDGTLLATRSADHAVRVWDVTSGRLLIPPLWHLDQPCQVNFSSDDRFLMTFCFDGTVWYWDLAAAAPPGPRLPDVKQTDHAVFSPDGRVAMTFGMAGAAGVWDAASGLPSGPLISIPAHVLADGKFSPDGRTFAVVGRQTDQRSAAWVCDMETRRVKAGPLVLDYAGTGSGIHQIAWSPDGRRIGVLAGAGPYDAPPLSALVRVWAAQTGEPVTPVVPHDSVVYGLEFSPDGRSLVTAGQEVRILDASSDTPRFAPIMMSSTIARYSPDGRRLLIAGTDTVRVWDAATGRPISPTMHHNTRIREAFFTRDGGRLVTASSEYVMVWDAATGSLSASPMQFPLRIGSVAPSPDGRQLLVKCGEVAYTRAPGFVQIVDLATGWPATPPLWREHVISEARFSPDGHRLATIGGVGGALFWNLVPDHRPLEDLVRMAEVVSGTRIDASGASIPITMKDVQEARNALLREDPETFSARREQVVGWRHQQLLLCEAAGNVIAALTHLDWLITHGLSVEALHARRKALVARLTPEESVAYWRAAIRLEPDDAVAHLELAKTLRRSGPREEAAAEFREAVRLKPDDAATHFAFGSFYHDTGERDAELAEFREAARLDTKGIPYARSELVWILTLSPVPRLRNPAEALDHARKAVEITQGTHPEFQTTLALAAYRSGLYEEARAALDKAKALGGKEEATSLFVPAMIHAQKGEKEQARPWFDKAVAWMKALPYQGMYHRLLWAEAAELLGQPGPASN